MKIVCISDIHGHIDNLIIPKCDILLIGGDVSKYGRDIHRDANWFNFEFNNWLSKQPAKNIVMTPGNHDIIFDKSPSLISDLKCEILIDKMIDIDGLKIYGSPWSITFYNWGFNLDEDKLELVWEKIPKEVDILLLHCPPYGIMDYTKHPRYPSRRIGSKSLLKKINEVHPKLVIFGHNHGQPGSIEQNGITFINASIVDDLNKEVNNPIILEI